MPPIVKTLYLLRRKSCVQFGLNFCIFLLCHTAFTLGGTVALRSVNKKNSTFLQLLYT